MDSPTFSVIIAVYNGEATLKRAIDSVLAQRYPPMEVIIVDDGSIDDTAAVAHGYGDAVQYFYQKNAGVSAARNAGARRAKGEWLAFLDADDWYYPERLSSYEEWIRRDPGLDFITADFEYRRPDGSLLGCSMEKTKAGRAVLKAAGANEKAVMDEELLEFFIEQHFGDTHTLSLRRETFLELGGYPEGIAVCEDVNLLIRLVARSRRVGVICKPVAVYLIHEASATRSDPLRAQRQTLHALSLLSAEVEHYARPVIRRGLEGALRHARLDLSYVLLQRGHRAEALATVWPLLWKRPSFQSVRDVASIMRGTLRRSHATK